MSAQTGREEAVAETGAVSATTSQGCRSAATGSCRKRQEGSHLEPPGGAQPADALVLDMELRLREESPIALSHPVCSTLLWKPQEAHLSIK